ncbi:MAG: hypothetical protein QOJ62_314 [Actinomycetota bacterium]|jgi:hypothetical protein|nr:hypothetical protein [Actinomycetota bacterium]
MTTILRTRPRLRAVQQAVAPLVRWRHLTRRDLQIALGVLWLLDGALQAQSFMFTRGFATQLIAPTGQGQPGVVSGPVHLASTVIAAHPFAWNLLFAAAQLLLGVGLLLRRTARVALIASIAWALGVWYVGEGLSGLASGHASILNGAPGSALLYAVIGAAAWPSGTREDEAPARWLVRAWAVLWVGAAIYQLLPGQNTGSDVSSVLTGAAGAAPSWLTQVDTSIATWAGQHGALVVVGLAGVEFLVGVAALSRKTRTWALAVGIGLSLAIWVFGQDLGQLYSGQSTDPNSAPLIALMGVALLARSRKRETAPLAADMSAVA